jgi:hypothetical protein
LQAAKEALIHEQRITPEANSDLVEDLSIVFVSIDFETDCAIADRVRIREMGISTFDTRVLIRHETEPHRMIQTQNYLCQKKSRRTYIFGQSSAVQQNEMGAILERAICHIRSKREATPSHNRSPRSLQRFSNS